MRHIEDASSRAACSNFATSTLLRSIFCNPLVCDLISLCIYYPVSDGAGSGYNDQGARRPPVRKERDDKVHDSIIEERIQRERPCRTLFIRNIKASRISDLTS